MAESSVQVTEGVGKKLHTWQRVITGPGTVEDEFMIPGEYPYASYTIVTDGAVVLATAASHLLQIMAGAALNVRIRRIQVSPFVPPAAINTMELQIVRLTTAGTGGTAKTPRRNSTADAAAGCTGMTLPTAKGTETDIWWSGGVTWPTAAIPGQTFPVWKWEQMPGQEPLIIAAGTTNGIALKNITGVATASCIVAVDLTETPFV
jgi:hypothetical protein